MSVFLPVCPLVSLFLLFDLEKQKERGNHIFDSCHCNVMCPLRTIFHSPFCEDRKFGISLTPSLSNRGPQARKVVQANGGTESSRKLTEILIFQSFEDNSTLTASGSKITNKLRNRTKSRKGVKLSEIIIVYGNGTYLPHMKNIMKAKFPFKSDQQPSKTKI